LLQEGVGNLLRHAGLELMHLVMDEEVKSLAGERHQQHEQRRAHRWGKEDGYCGASTFADGGTHVGEIHNNKANGPGTYTYPNGDKYSGELLDNRKEGQGTYTFANGTKLVGLFKDDNYIGSSSSPVPPAKGSSSAFEVSLDKQGGVLLVPVLINGKIPLDFVIDSGASDVTVPADVVSTLMRTGTLVPADFTVRRIGVDHLWRRIPPM